MLVEFWDASLTGDSLDKLCRIVQINSDAPVMALQDLDTPVKKFVNVCFV